MPERRSLVTLLRAAATLTLVALAVLASVASTGSVPHAHVAGEPALYNQEHDLSTLAALGSAAPLPAPVAVAAALVVLAVLPAPPSRLRSRRAGGHASRAPPATA
jgi:hypothetical protein